MIWIILPAYNEEEALPLLCDKIKNTFENIKENYTIVVVDDGSSDETPEILKKSLESYPLETITHEKNMGLGSALFNGLNEAADKGEEEDIIITLDAFTTHSPSLLITLIELIR